MKTPDSSWVPSVIADYEKPLTRYAAHIIGDTERAREVVQDTFLKLCRQKPAEIRNHLAQWLYTVCRIAKDVKIQVEFNPEHVSAYRLIGYEDRLMAREDFNDDTKDAGVIGAGHTVTALYELIPAGVALTDRSVDPLKYQKPLQRSANSSSGEWATVKIRSKDPDKDRSVLSEFTVKDTKRKFAEASPDYKFAAAVAAFGMVLRDSPHKGGANLERALEWASQGRGKDRSGYRQEFIRLVQRAISLAF